MRALLALAIPIILIHGYGEDSHVWDSWVNWLKADHFQVYPITFANDDQCGTVAQHAIELGDQINNILRATHSDKIDIVAHSKGGLDSRWYIAHNNVDRVANLVMIGTPNEGTAAAYLDLTSCALDGSAGLWDLQPNSDAAQSADKTQTHYYTIAGDYSVPCLFVVMHMYVCYLIPNDGWVTVTSVQSHYSPLGVYHYPHQDLVKHKDIYEKIRSILK